MSEKNSAAKRKYWTSIPISHRKAHKQKIAHSRWDAVSAEDRRKIAMKMVKARQEKDKKAAEVFMRSRNKA